MGLSADSEIRACVEIARLVHRPQHLAAQEDHVRRQPAACGDPALHRLRRVKSFPRSVSAAFFWELATFPPGTHEAMLSLLD